MRPKQASGDTRLELSISGLTATRLHMTDVFGSKFRRRSVNEVVECGDAGYRKWQYGTPYCMDLTIVKYAL